MTKIQLTADTFQKHATTIVCKVDTGAEVNVISEADYKQMFPNPLTRRLGLAQLLTYNFFRTWNPLPAQTNGQ